MFLLCGRAGETLLFPYFVLGGDYMANGSSKNAGSSNNPDAIADKIYQVAFNYVNFCRCNKTASLRKWYADNDFE